MADDNDDDSASDWGENEFDTTDDDDDILEMNENSLPLETPKTENIDDIKNSEAVPNNHAAISRTRSKSDGSLVVQVPYQKLKEYRKSSYETLLECRSPSP